MVNLKKKPFYLDEAQIKWVEDTYASMTVEEKIGQLFINLTLHREPEYITELCEKFHIGGVRWQGGTLEEVYEQNKLFQEKSRIPVMIAANCEAGGNGAVKEGTLVASGAACGAASDSDVAYQMGKVGGAEAAAVGCNITFAPVSDVLYNWRNTIVNFRAFGKTPDEIIDRSKAYMQGMRENNMACCTKHFPGDGVEARDQHLVMGCNDLSCEEWDDSFGRIYKALIDEGIEAFMIGHICMPAYSRKLRPDIQDADIMPATLAPELLQDLLRDQLGFNGVVITDASHMVGLSAAATRREQVQGVIAAGCDMILFFNDPEEDFQYMLEGYHAGTITEERLSDAIHRILGMKAKMGLHQLQFPARELLGSVGCDAHMKIAAYAADESITLVKDTQKLLPVSVEEKRRVALYFIQSAPISCIDGTDKAKQIFVEELERVGFLVAVHKDYYECELEQPSAANRYKVTHPGKMEEFKKNYDLVLLVTNMRGYAQESNVRIKWSVSHSAELPWYIHEVPTVGVSLSYTNHLYDLPALKTYINAYSDTREYIRAVVEKLTGQSEFKGRYDDNVWCDRWDTRL